MGPKVFDIVHMDISINKGLFSVVNSLSVVSMGRVGGVGGKVLGVKGGILANAPKAPVIGYDGTMPGPDLTKLWKNKVKDWRG